MLTIKQVVEQLRDELEGMAFAADRGPDRLRFEVTGAEVELQVVVTEAREAGGGGKVGFHIGVVQVGVDGAAKAQHAEARTHKVKLSLKPKQGKKSKAPKDNEESDEVLIGRRRRGGEE
jgi:hypothetical protein